MISRKTLGLAAALSLLIPLGAADAPVEHGTLVRAHLASVEGIPLAPEPGGPLVAPAVEEGVMEGHTTFAVVEVERRSRSPDTLAVVGHVSCPLRVLGVGVPASALTDAVSPGCREGDPVFIAERGAPPPVSRDALEPTGWATVVQAPDTAEPVLISESRYTVMDVDETGAPNVRDVYAWETAVRAPGVNPHSGASFNFVGAVNVERVWERGGTGVTVYTGDAWFG